NHHYAIPSFFDSRGCERERVVMRRLVHGRSHTKQVMAGFEGSDPARMKLPLYWIDAFADRVFAGNPAAVVPLERWLPDATMQAIAKENGLSETAFLVP